MTVTIKSKRVQVFLGCVGLAGVLYLSACLFDFGSHPEMPWFERGIYGGGMYGFPYQIVLVLIGLGYLVFGKDE